MSLDIFNIESLMKIVKGEQIAKKKNGEECKVVKFLGGDLWKAIDENGKEYVVRHFPEISRYTFAYPGNSDSGFDELYVVKTNEGLEFVGKIGNEGYKRYTYDCPLGILAENHEHGEVSRVDVFGNFVVMYEGKYVKIYNDNGDFLASSYKSDLDEIFPYSDSIVQARAIVFPDGTKYHLFIRQPEGLYEFAVDANGIVSSVTLKELTISDNRNDQVRTIGLHPIIDEYRSILPKA